MSCFRRTVVALILAPLVGVSGVLPQEHVHEADADHHHSAAHRHVHLHDAESPDGDHAQLAAGGEAVVWLGGAALNQATYHLVAPPVGEVAEATRIEPASVWMPGLDYSAAPPHGPPRVQPSLRAPPADLPALI